MYHYLFLLLFLLRDACLLHLETRALLRLLGGDGEDAISTQQQLQQCNTSSARNKKLDKSLTSFMLAWSCAASSSSFLCSSRCRSASRNLSICFSTPWTWRSRFSLDISLRLFA